MLSVHCGYNNTLDYETGSKQSCFQKLGSGKIAKAKNWKADRKKEGKRKAKFQELLSATATNNFQFTISVPFFSFGCKQINLTRLVS